jgi:hypothetical protein
LRRQGTYNSLPGHPLPGVDTHHASGYHGIIRNNPEGKDQDMLKFRRIESGHYQADTDQRRYRVVKTQYGWVVRVWQLLETAGVKHTIGLGLDDAEASASPTDTKTLAVDIARRYEQLTAEGYGQLFTDLRPMTRATIDAYQAEEAAWNARQENS